MLVLASQSPRRRRLLKTLGFEFQVQPVDIDESKHQHESPEEMVARLASEKAMALCKKSPLKDDDLVLAADTIVVLGDTVLGKPQSREHAVEMLRQLSGKTHRVLSGVCVINSKGKSFQITVRTDVTFRELRERGIQSYVKTGEPDDKAGSYAIQGQGCALIDLVDGSYTNVIGLPVKETLALLDMAQTED